MNEKLNEFTIHLYDKDVDYIKKQMKNSYYSHIATNDQDMIRHYLYCLLLDDMETKKEGK